MSARFIPSPNAHLWYVWKLERMTTKRIMQLLADDSFPLQLKSLLRARLATHAFFDSMDDKNAVESVYTTMRRALQYGTCSECGQGTCAGSCMECKAVFE